MFKVIIAGSRNFTNYYMLKEFCNNALKNIQEPIEIVSGGAKGADMLGEQYAREVGYPVKLFPAKWNALGKTAGYIRNQEMANYADALIAFWDGKSKGTHHMIETAKSCGLKVRVKRYINLA